MKKIISIALILSILSLLLVSCEMDKDSGSGSNGDTGGAENGETACEAIDLFTADLSEYVEIEEKYYKGYTVIYDPDRVSEFDISERITQLLCEYKIEPETTPEPAVNVTVGAGDVVNIYYSGYILEDGAKNYFDGGCNISSGSSDLEIGSGTFISGFEYGLIGKNQQDYAVLEMLETGTVEAGDIIKLTYSAILPTGGVYQNKTAYINLADSDLDDTYGEGFTSFFTDGGIEIGELYASAEESLVAEMPDGTAVYTDMTVSCVYRASAGKEKLVIEAYFPDSYSQADLAGKTSYFEVYIQSVTDYEVLEFNDEFINGSLEMTDDLATYEGETLTDRFIAYLRDEIMTENGWDLETLTQTAFWESVIGGAVIKKYPEGNVTELYDQIVAEAEEIYESNYLYAYYYPTLESFMCAYFGTSDWQSLVLESVRNSIKQQMIFYHIMRLEGLIPSEEEYAEIFDEYLDYALEINGITPDKYDTAEEYESDRQLCRAEILEMYGEDNFKQMIYYECAIEIFLSYAIVETV